MTTTFIYRGWDPSGRIVRGSIRASSAADATQMVNERGIRQIGPVSTAGATFRIKNWFVGKPTQRITFFRSLASLMEAGVPAPTAFILLADQISAEISMRNNKLMPWTTKAAKHFLATIRSIYEELVNGSRISTTLSRRPDDFTDVEVAMIAAGEKAGSTEHVVGNLATYLERDRKFRKTITSALTYPIVVSGAAFFLVAGLGIFIVPKFVDLYAGFGATLPTSMKVMVFMSNLLKNPVVMGGGFMIFVAFCFFLVRSIETPNGALTFDRLRMKVPVLGDLIRKNIMISVAKVMRMLTDAGENPVAALDIMTQITNSPVYSRALVQARDSLSNGYTANIHDALANTGVFDPFYLGYVRIGQKAGNLSEMLEKVTEHYEEDVAALVAQIPVIIQTVMIVFLGLIVGSIVISVFSAITNLTSSIH